MPFLLLQDSTNPNLRFVRRGTSTDNTDNRAQISGVISNALFGYTLLSK